MITFTFYFWPKSLDRPLHVSLDFRGSITDTSIDLITFSQFQFDLQWQSQFLQIFDEKKGWCWKQRDQDDDDELVKQDDDDWNEGAWGKSEATYGATWRLTTCPIFSITVVIVIILFQIIIVQFSAFPQSPVSSLLLLWLELQSPPKIIMVKTKIYLVKRKFL